MKVYKVKNYEEMSEKGAQLLAAQVTLKPESFLGLATGSTPLGIYKKLADWNQKGLLDFSQVKTANLDEYKGIGRDNEQSYYYYMNENLFSKTNIRPEHTMIPDGSREDAEKVCEEYERQIAENGSVDIQLLGIGRNGHIGFNEPADSFAAVCHCVDLAPSTIEANQRFFEKEEDVPRQAYTMGIGTIMKAKKILLTASGKDKSKALKELIEGEVTPEVPATILRFHPDVTVIADEDALSEVSEAVLSEV